MERAVREESVKTPEMGKRFACYHSLRKGEAAGARPKEGDKAYKVCKNNNSKL
jgi:hypothetical protein